MTTELLARIVVDPHVCAGRPTIRGHRIWVSLVLGYLAEGWTVDAIVDDVRFGAVAGVEIEIERGGVSIQFDHQARRVCGNVDAVSEIALLQHG